VDSWRRIEKTLSVYPRAFESSGSAPILRRYIDTGDVTDYLGAVEDYPGWENYERPGLSMALAFAASVAFAEGLVSARASGDWSRMTHSAACRWMFMVLTKAPGFTAYATNAAFLYALGFRSQGDDIAGVLLRKHSTGKVMPHAQATFPIMHLITRIALDWRGGEPIPFGKGATQSPECNRLFEVWRTPNFNEFVDAALPYLAFRETRCCVDLYSDEDLPDFQISDFHRFPVDLMMILRMREWLGLPVGEIPHPLFEDPICHPPRDLAFEMDEMTQAVYRRMQEQGFVHSAWAASSRG
jgi:hypothetical protein